MYAATEFEHHVMVTTHGVRKGQRTRRRLLDAAAAELANAGPNGASLADIAARAGMQSGSVYFHFESREALFLAVLDHGLRESVARLKSRLDDNDDAIDRLRTAIRVHVELMTELRDYTTVALTMTDLFDHETTRAFRALRRRYSSCWIDIVGQAMADDQLPAIGSPDITTELILGALNALRRHATDDSIDIVRAVECLLGIQVDVPDVRAPA